MTFSDELSDKPKLWKPDMVYILDDDDLIRRLAGKILKNGGFDTTLFAHPKDFFEGSITDGVCCLLTDYQMPFMDGLQVQQEMERKGWNIPIVFMSAFATIPVATQAMKKGAIDFLEKPFTNDELVATVRTALNRARLKLKDREMVSALSDRELEVLRYLVGGCLNKQVASQLGISERTVKAHRAKIMEKFEVDSIALVVQIATRAGIKALHLD